MSKENIEMIYIYLGKVKKCKQNCKRLDGKGSYPVLDILDNLHHRLGDLTMPKPLQTFEQHHPMLV
jgi:hypothetical protein